MDSLIRPSLLTAEQVATLKKEVGPLSQRERLERVEQLVLQRVMGGVDELPANAIVAVGADEKVPPATVRAALVDAQAGLRLAKLLPPEVDERLTQLIEIGALAMPIQLISIARATQDGREAWHAKLPQLISELERVKLLESAAARKLSERVRSGTTIWPESLLPLLNGVKVFRLNDMPSRPEDAIEAVLAGAVEGLPGLKGSKLSFTRVQLNAKSGPETQLRMTLALGERTFNHVMKVDELPNDRNVFSIAQELLNVALVAVESDSRVQLGWLSPDEPSAPYACVVASLTSTQAEVVGTIERLSPRNDGGVLPGKARAILALLASLGLLDDLPPERKVSLIEELTWRRYREPGEVLLLIGGLTLRINEDYGWDAPPPVGGLKAGLKKLEKISRGRFAPTRIVVPDDGPGRLEFVLAGKRYRSQVEEGRLFDKGAFAVVQRAMVDQGKAVGLYLLTLEDGADANAIFLTETQARALQAEGLTIAGGFPKVE